MSEDNLESVIEDAVNDSVSPDAGPVDSSDDVVESPTPDTSGDAPDDATEADTSEVSSPAVGGASAPVEDEFSKKYGIPAQSVTGRENRIPYSRVKKIVTKAQTEAAAVAKKAAEAEFQPKFAEFETKVKDYEGRLEKVAQFEHILENDPRTFLNMLSQVPAYKEFFDWVRGLAQGGQQPPQGQANPTNDMPQPDQTLNDGSKVYSMEGLQKLLEWQASQVENRVTKQVTERYQPIEQEWESQKRMAQLTSVVDKQISEAKTWPHFTENEPEIVAALKADRNLSLEGAYRKVVYPKLLADRSKIRAEVLEEIKKKPVNSAAPTAPTKPVQGQVSQGPRDTEDIIRESLAQAGLLK